jgi:hypothetical protein
MISCTRGSSRADYSRVSGKLGPGAAERHMRETRVISHEEAGQVVTLVETPPVGTDPSPGMFHEGQEGTDGSGEPGTLFLGSQ